MEELETLKITNAAAHMYVYPMPQQLLSPKRHREGKGTWFMTDSCEW